MTVPDYVIIVAVVFIAAAIVFWYRRRTRRIMENLNRILDIAIAGDFSEKHFDESMLSSVETKLAHYLAASAASARNVQTEKEKIKALIADISHQTKTPIANILLYTQLLSEQELLPESRPCIDSLEVQSRKLQSLIEALVKTSRLESGIIALRPAAGNLAPVIRSAVSQLMPKAEAKGIAIVTESADANGVFDPKWTEEAVFNLLDNAVKYTPAGGEVRVSVTSYELFSAVHVSDNGPGISEEEQPKIFQRFYRGMGNQTTEGVGVGLYLVRQIAEGQGGFVRVSSGSKKGSVFSLFLPSG